MAKKTPSLSRSRFRSVVPHLGEPNSYRTGEKLGEIILGGQDGLVNTLGVILGVAAASQDLRIIVAGGMAAAVAESVSMAAVGYTSKLVERDYYLSALGKEKQEIDHMPEEEIQEIREIYANKGFSGQLLEDVVKAITSDRELWLSTMMKEELDLSSVDIKKPAKSAFLIGLAAILGSFIPLLSFAVFYFTGFRFTGYLSWAVGISIFISAVTLFIVGAVKSRLTIGKWYRSGIQMVLIGICSAFFGYAVGLIFNLPAG